MFADLEPRAPDAILGLMERFRADDRPDKVSLASGVYVDESAVTPVLDTVREAEARILAGQTTKVYKPIGGDPAYNGPVRDLVFGADHPAVTGGRVVTMRGAWGGEREVIENGVVVIEGNRIRAVGSADEVSMAHALGLRVDPGRSLLVPTAHDEPAIHLDLPTPLFATPLMANDLSSFLGLSVVNVSAIKEAIRKPTAHFYVSTGRQRGNKHQDGNHDPSLGILL